MNNPAVQGVYWFLLAIALLFAAAGLWQVYRVTSAGPLQVRVLDRTVKVEVRELSGKRGKYKALFAVAELRLERLDNRAVVTMTEESLVKKEELIELAFLDPWEQGTLIPAAASGGTLQLNPASPWTVALAFGVGFWMFGTFAWMVHPFIAGDGFSGVGLKFFALALLPIGLAGFAIWKNISEQRAEEALQRVPVEVKVVALPVPGFIDDLKQRGIHVADGVAEYLGKPDDNLTFGEFVWEGKPMRNASVYMSPGMTMRGRLNPANPRDMKWDQ